MSFESIAWGVKQNTGNSVSKLILLMLCNYADDKHTCYPSIEHIAKICHCSVRTVSTHIKELQRKGLIKIGKHKRKIFNLNVYILGSANPAVVQNTAISSARDADNTNINKYEIKKRTKNKNFIMG